MIFGPARQWQKNLRMGRKIQLLTLISTCISLLFALVTIATFEFYSMRKDMIEYVSTLADATGKNSAAALTFDDVDLAMQVLDSMAADPQITLAGLYREDGARLIGHDFGAESRPTWTPAALAWLQTSLANDAHGHLFEGLDSLHMLSPISFDGEEIGHIYIRSNLDKLITNSQLTLVVAVFAMFVAALVAYFLASRLQGLVTTPVAGLVDLAEKVTRDGDFSLRGEKLGNDEIGVLVDGFNGMLGELESRDERLQKHRVELEKQVADRTRSLEGAVAQLKLSRDKAEAASLAKSEFLARMSHEIRTPMNGVLGMTELLLSSTELNDRQARYAGTIQHSAEALLDIINDILDFSKIEAGKLELDKAPFDFRDTIEESVELLAERAQAKGLELILDLPKNLHSAVVGDSVRVRQVLVNFVSNAIKFTETGEIVVRVREVANAGKASAFEVAVSDTGIGIHEANIDRIFESFSQEDGSTTRRFGGTGLGLAICKQLVGLMDGEISVTSIPGRGSTFSFTVPLEREPARSAGLAPDALEGVRALIVDDNATNREILSHQLRGWKMHADEAESGATALKLVLASMQSSSAYDVVILDLHMPGMDGLQVARQIRAIPGSVDLNILMLSSITADATDSELAQAGVQAWLTKPVRQARLHACLKAILTRELPITQAPQQAENGEQELAAIRVLLVEDNPVNQEVARGMLDQLNCVIEVAADGADGLERFVQGDFDLVLMDCQMPRMDGFEATRRIRDWESQNYRARTPILALTANALQGDRERCISAGMDGYLSKPYSQQKLQERMQAILPQFQHLETTGILKQQTFVGKLVDLGPAEIESVPDEPDSDTVIDLETLQGIEELQAPGEPSLLGEVLSLFLKSSLEQREQLATAVAADDAASIWQISHALRSSSGVLGARALAESCARFETLARAGDLADGQAMLAEVKRQHALAIIALKDYVQKVSA